MLVSGLSLTIIEQDITAFIDFWKYLVQADTVIVYRSSPAQKSEVVKSVQKLVPGKLTLAVGDGFNDVNMI